MLINSKSSKYYAIKNQSKNCFLLLFSFRYILNPWMTFSLRMHLITVTVQRSNAKPTQTSTQELHSCS